MKNNSEIERLEAEVSRLKAELEKAREREELAEGSRRIILNMMEEVNESAEGIARGKKEWEATFDGISDPLFIHDNKFRIIRAIRAYQKMSGLEFQKIIGMPYYEIFPVMEGPFDACANKAELLEGREEEISVTHLDRVYRLRLYPIKGERGEYLYSVHILEDVTEARRAQERTKEEMEVTSHFL
ncbi:MAG: PAS domain-containing protein, partial [Deltaproteobacteria bacterium]